MKRIIHLGIVLLVLMNVSCASESISFLSEPGSIAVFPYDNIGPTVEILSPKSSSGTRSSTIKIKHPKNTVEIKGIVRDPSGVLTVQVNGVEVSLKPDDSFSITVPLDSGTNKLDINAVDKKKNETQRTLSINHIEWPSWALGKYYALVIGIDRYQEWPNLETAVTEAQGIAGVLESDYGFDEVYTLYDKEATRENIIRLFERLERVVTEEDNVLIYYAGHGDLNEDRRRGYWVPVEAALNSSADYISNADIQLYLRGIKSKHTLLVADACFAGDLARGIRGRPSTETEIKDSYKRLSRQVMTSGGIEEVPDGSVFAFHFLKALKENEAPYLPVQALFEHIKPIVTINSPTKQVPQFNALRETGDEGGEFIFIRQR